MAVNWTDEQQQAITTTDRGVIVSATAGSGKTAVLIERTVRLLEDEGAGCPAEKLLAVTFTKDAANQMKTKLRAALTSRIVGQTDAEKRSWLERQQDMLSLAKISTINAFCLELVNDNLNELDYRTEIKVADDEQAEVILNESLDEALEIFRGQSPEQAELLLDALTNNSDYTLKERIRSFYDFKCSLAFPNEWIATAISDFSDKKQVDKRLNVFFEQLSEQIEPIEKKLELATFSAGLMLNNEKVLDVLMSDSDILNDIKAPLKSGSFSVLFKACSQIKFETIRKPSKKGLTDEEASDNDQIYSEIKSIRDGYKDQIKALAGEVASLGSDIYEPMKDAGMILSALADVTEILECELHERKVGLGVAQFGDIERMAMNLLIKREDGVAKRTELAQRLVDEHIYRVMLIDEYQDINNLQEMIFRCLSDSKDLDHLGSNAFAVGDVKQSIYRFRLSNPKLFLETEEKARDKSIEGLCEIRLSKNFRSRQNIVDYVNWVFHTVMSKKLGELDYTEDEELKCGAYYGGEDEPVELMLVDDAQEDEEQLRYVIFGSEELVVARRIKQLLSEGAPVYSGDVSRPCRASDVCVLSRKKDGCRRISAALEYVGLKAQSEQLDGYMGAKEILTMVNLLKVIDNPMRDLPMAAVMMSPILNFTAEETAALRRLCFESPDSAPKRLYQIILSASKSEDSDEREAQRIELNDEALEQKCDYAIELISRLRFYSVSLTIEELIMRIYDETGFFAVAGAYENSKQKRANLRLLTRRAADYERDSAGGIAGFLRYLDRVSDAGRDFSQAAATVAGSDSVAVKTFHGSKGLEFPFVFLINLNATFNLSDISDRILLNEQAGVGINYMCHDKLMKVSTLSHAVLANETKSEMLSEELRLLYVALTRAKERLFITFSVSESGNGQKNMKKKLQTLASDLALAGGADSTVLKGCNTFEEWLAAAAMLSKDNQTLLEAIEREDISGQLSGYGIKGARIPKVTWTAPTKEGTQSVTKTFVQPAANQSVVEALKRRYEFDYGVDDSRAASKRTVTEIVTEVKRLKEGDNDRAFYPKLGSLKEESTRLSAAQRGTFTHLYMELADYNNAQRDAKAELERLVSIGSLSKREASGVYIGAVKAFFDGEFYARMKRSSDIRREMKFMVKASDAGIDERFPELIAPDGMIQGICDCIFKEPDGYVLVDYKTDGFVDVSELDRYGVQLELYKAALDIILDLPVKACYIYSFKLSTGREITL